MLSGSFREAGPLDAEHTVLMLPGGVCSAGSYAPNEAPERIADVILEAVGHPG